MDKDPQVRKALFTKGDPLGKAAGFISSKKNKGWFANWGVPDLPIDEEVISEEEGICKILSENTFRGPNSWYVNSEENKSLEILEINLKSSLFVHHL